MIKNKKGAEGLTTQKMIIGVLVVLVVVIVIGALWKLGGLDFLKNLAGFNQTQVNTDLIVTDYMRHYDGNVNVLLDDGSGRCVVIGYADESKKINNGFYGLEKKQLIYKNSAGEWESIENEVASDDMIWKRGLQVALDSTASNLKSTYNGKSIRVYFNERDGLWAYFDNNERYDWDGNKLTKIINGKESEVSPRTNEYLDKLSVLLGALDYFEYGGEDGRIDMMIAKDGKRILWFSIPFGRYFYGIANPAAGSMTRALYVLDKEQVDSKAWAFLSDKYLNDDTEWKNMEYKQKIKDDLTKICSSR